VIKMARQLVMMCLSSIPHSTLYQTRKGSGLESLRLPSKDEVIESNNHQMVASKRDHRKAQSSDSNYCCRSSSFRNQMWEKGRPGLGYEEARVFTVWKAEM
jgi:hypothetical protein